MTALAAPSIVSEPARFERDRIGRRAAPDFVEHGEPRAGRIGARGRQRYDARRR